MSQKRNLFESKKSISRVYKQYTPARSELVQNFLVNKPEDERYHAIDLVDYGSHKVLFWMEVPSKTIGNDQLQKTLIDGSYEDHVSFVRSFKILLF